MPIQYTGERINSEGAHLEKTACEFASLTQQGKTEKSHEYAATMAQQIAVFLFELSMATETNVSDMIADGRLQRTIELCKTLGVMATQGGRSHNWVQRICFNAIHLMQRLEKGNG